MANSNAIAAHLRRAAAAVDLLFIVSSADGAGGLVDRLDANTLTEQLGAIADELAGALKQLA